MAKTIDSSKAQIAFQVKGSTPGQLLVSRYHGTEGLSQLYRFEIDLVAEDADASLDDAIGQPAVMSIFTPYGDRWVHGIVGRIAHLGETVGQTYYRVELVPALWLLTHRYQSRIIQDKNVLEIISAVLAQAGFLPDYVDKQRITSDAHPPREYCVQYRETDLNFVSRLLEDEGIYYYFEQTETGHRMVLAESREAYIPIAGNSALPYQAPTGLNAPEEYISRLRFSQEMRAGVVVLGDYDFKNPVRELQSTGDLERNTGLQISDHPGRFLKAAHGEKVAARRAEESETGRQAAVGISNSNRLVPGRSYTLKEHPTVAFNREYLVTKVTSQGKQVTTRGSDGSGNPAAGNGAAGGRPSARWLQHGGAVNDSPLAAALAQGGDPESVFGIASALDDAPGFLLNDKSAPFECLFACVPAEVLFRPARLTPRPLVHGSQTARVVGPEGEEIQTDEFGRVKVQFNWDREGNEGGEPKRHGADSSCWIRVSQGLAGGAYGMMFLPRVGQEVVVDFLEGDPDQPVIIGRLYNADQRPPYELPAEKTKSVIKTNSTVGGGGSNEIRFEDLKDREQLLLHAQKNLHIRVRNDRIENIDHDRHLTVKENKYELVKKGKHSEVTLDCQQKVGGNKLVAVSGDLGQEISGKHSDKVGTDYYLYAGQDLVLEAGSSLTLKVGGNFIKIDASGITILGTKVDINCSGGSAGVGTGVPLQEFDPPLTADTVTPGLDFRYSGADAPPPGTVGQDVAGLTGEPSDQEVDTSWIEIELVDEAGQPVPREAYEIIAPDGETIRRGQLNELGQAHVSLPEQGTYNVCFPNLDARAWEGA